MDSINIKFESFYGVYKVLPDGYKVAILNDLYKTTKTTSKIWEGKEFIVKTFHTGYYEKYIIFIFEFKFLTHVDWQSWFWWQCKT